MIPKPAACTSVSAALRSKAQVADKVEVQEALPPAGVLGAEPLRLMPQHFPREPAKRCFRAMAAIRDFSTVCVLRSKAFLTRFAARRAAGEQAKSASRQKSSPQASFFDDLTAGIKPLCFWLKWLHLCENSCQRSWHPAARIRVQGEAMAGDARDGVPC